MLIDANGASPTEETKNMVEVMKYFEMKAGIKDGSLTY